MAGSSVMDRTKRKPVPIAAVRPNSLSTGRTLNSKTRNPAMLVRAAGNSAMPTVLIVFVMASSAPILGPASS